MKESMDKAISRALLPIEGFVPLVVDSMLKRRMSIAELARKSGLSKKKLSRGFAGEVSMDIAAFERLFVVLEIDPQRAVLACCQLQSWRRYHDPDIAIIAEQIHELPAHLAAARDGGERITLPPGGVRLLAERISAVIADNDRKVVERRNSFMLETDLRPIRRD
jgi:transcriptional regulator with XRE-family HTH domain